MIRYSSLIPSSSTVRYSSLAGTLAIVFCSLPGFGWAQEADKDRPQIIVTGAALKIHAASPVVDGHNDLPWEIRKTDGRFKQFDIAKSQPQFHTDIQRLRTGGVGAQFWSVYVPVSTTRQGSALSTTLEQIALVKEMCDRYPDTFELALNAADVDRIREEGKIASMIGVEGGHSIENSLSVLQQLYKQGARYMTLTHSESLDWADSCTGEPKNGGLSEFGEEVVREMNKLGMLVDISHVSADCMRHVLRVTDSPVIFSHSSAFAIANHPRNVPDDVLKLTQKNGGVVMINFFNDFINPYDAMRSTERIAVKNGLRAKFPDDEEKSDAELKKWELGNPRSDRCTVHDVLDHIDHVVKVAGIQSVGLGSDFDGIPAVPKQLEDVASYPVITQGMLDRGYSESDIKKVLGENVMRVFRAATK
ncbi:dipeptidase [Planctomycetes bacterium K23_9]|uniref:Membrane dipeptidase (Peptidase family M19) n=1 Tax=Stieleria marina TaxID=1930275 RepID=A0A517P396_9BACT|nr:Membrane dipeptidase (Peptidase family M19) [Planctomycetes bacterium K23_9]